MFEAKNSLKKIHRVTREKKAPFDESALLV